MFAATSFAIPVVYELLAEPPGPSAGLTMATTRTVGCAIFASTIAVQDASLGSV
jgi:hypothetical protein